MQKHFALFVMILLVFCQNIFCQIKNNEIKSGSSNTNSSQGKKIIKFGVASYYANKFKGQETANGEIYQHEKFTAACNQLPLNTWIKVTFLKNKRSVIVRINDRLNSHNKRLVDLSKAAAQKLGIIGYGIAKVKVEVLDHYLSDN